MLKLKISRGLVKKRGNQYRVERKSLSCLNP